MFRRCTLLALARFTDSPVVSIQPDPPPWPVESGVRLYNPPQLFCLLIGDLPGFSDECRLRNRRSSIDLLWETLAMKLSRVRPAYST